MLQTILMAATLSATGLSNPDTLGALPYRMTPAHALSTANLQHVEALRIVRDFGKPDYSIALDVWQTTRGHDRIGDVRVWWVRTSAKDEREPFDAKVMRYLDLDYAPRSAKRWDVRMTGDRKAFQFSVELDEAGKIAAYVDIVTDRGARVEHCRAKDGQLIARRFVGIPIGISRLELSCVDQAGRTHEGTLPYRTVARGRLYEP